MAFRIHSLFICAALFLLSLYNVDAFNSAKWLEKSPINSFSWKNCGPSSDPLQVKTLAITPDPIEIPGNFTINGTAGVTTALPKDIRISLTMEKKVGGFYIKVPCIDNVGSCNYGNICEAWASFCPKYFEKYGIPCNCPIPPNVYSVPGAVVEIKSSLPSIIQGDFRATADISSNEGHLGCLQIELTLKT